MMTYLYLFLEFFKTGLFSVGGGLATIPFLKEIAENEGITRQGVNDLIKRAEVQLYDLEDKYHYSERFMRLKELGAKINSGDNKDLAKILEIIEQL